MNRKIGNRKSRISENDADLPKTPKVENELVVTGVSRSGRVRKKSSKLIDYESGAEEIERRRRKLDTAVNNSQRTVSVKDSFTEYGDNEGMVGSNRYQQNPPDSDAETNAFPPTETYENSSGDTSGTELEDDLIDDKLNLDEGTSCSHTEITYPRSMPTNITNTSQKSLYMLEKFAKKKKNGRGAKAGRKDKGKARFSAYMLWAREVRPDLMKSNPNIGDKIHWYLSFLTWLLCCRHEFLTRELPKDFSRLSSKLSDLWATVPYSDKYMWKQKAKRMAMLAKNVDNQEEANVQKAQIKTTLRRKYINKKNTPSNIKSKSEAKPLSMLTEITSLNTSSPTAIDNKPHVSERAALSKAASTQPLDVAAHLKLLGESLSIIGQRLKEHEGQIAVSGSLSVLLDTLLCSLGPLLCLTRQIEEMNGCSEETLSRILDNIAYIMPGL